MFYHHSSNISAVASTQTQLDVFNLPSLSRGMWSAWLSQGVCVFVFHRVKHKPLGLNIAGILFLFPFLSLSLTPSVLLSLSLFLSWLLCHCGEGNSDPIVNGGNWAAGQWCHPAIGKTRGNALLAFGMRYFFPVVFRKAVINLIPSSSLPAPSWGWGWGEEMQRIERGWGTLLPVQTGM